MRGAALASLTLIAMVLGEVAHLVAHPGAPDQIVRALAGAWLMLALAAGHEGAAEWRRAHWSLACAAAAATILLVAGAIVVAARQVPLVSSLGGSRIELATRSLAAVIAALPLVWLGGRMGRWSAATAAGRWPGRALIAVGLTWQLWTCLAYFRDLGLVRLASGGRVDQFDRLLVVLREQYTHWSYAPVGPEALAARYRPRIVAADLECGDSAAPCAPYLEAIRDMLAELRDMHAGLVHPFPLHTVRATAVSTDLVEDRLAIVAVAPGSDAAAAGLRPGMEITAVGGASPASAVAAVPAWQVSFSSRLTERRARHFMALVGPPGSSVTIRARDAGGGEREATLTRSRAVLTDGAAVTSRRLDGRALYIAVPRLTGPDVVAAFDAALDGALDAPGLVIDLRQNTGGSSGLGDRMVARLVERPAPYLLACFARPHLLHRFETGCHTARVAPRPPIYRGPVAVLLDAMAVSSGEQMAAALCDSGRARCFGRPTAGASGWPFVFLVSGGVVAYSTGESYRLDGTPLEGRGIPPHEQVAWTLADLAAGRDPDLAAAQRWLASAAPR